MVHNGPADESALNSLKPGPLISEVIGRAELGRMPGGFRVDLRPDGVTLSIRKMTAAMEEGAQNGR
jgi:hypothetical protein